MNRPKPLVLIILDGWGYRAETKANAIALARKPTYDRLLREYPNTLIQTSGHSVGLPDGQMGNSEVGHLNIGAGRIVHMDSTRIELMIQNGEFFSHPVLLSAMKNARSGGRRLHLFGLLSDGGVHSYQTHLYALLKMAKQNGVDRVFVHAFMDGRDTLPTNGAGYLEQLQQKMREYNTGKIASVRTAATTPWTATAAGSASPSVQRHGLRRRRRRQIRRPGAGRKRFLQQGRDRRIHRALRLRGQSRRAAGHHPRRRFLHLLQLPRRPRPPDHSRPDAQQRPEPARRKRSAWRRRSRRCHPPRSRAEESALRLHDPVRQEIHASGGDPAGVDGQYSRQRDGDRRAFATCA